MCLAYLARFEFDPAALRERDFLPALGLLVVVRLLVNYRLRLGMSRWRFVGLRDLVRLFGALTLGTAIFGLLTWMVPFFPRVPRSILLLEWLFSGYLTGGLWVIYRIAYERVQVLKGGARRRVLVVGAGEAGAQLVHQMLRSGVGLTPVALVDDDPLKWGMLVHGVEVVGGIHDVEAIAADQLAQEILICIPSATAGEFRRIVEFSEETTLPIKVLPGLHAAFSGEVDLSRIREIRVEDLLGRDPVQLELPELSAALSSQAVLVTGAAGSIGSELVRQIALHGPQHLVLVDQAETPLYFLERRVRREFPEQHLTCVIRDVTRADVVDSLFERFQPDRVYHAAAYKHVPVMEANPLEAVRTNMVGTHNVADAAGRHGAGTFVLVSTDKAVDPANVMGATKHVAERLVLGAQKRFPATTFAAVRFGNVLGSNGSVIPIFREQLARGEPLTVTHADVTRYFMTIPEAAQLILQASIVPEIKGRIAMLDMGEPIRIMDLARDLLHLSGKPFRLGSTVKVVGLRPGEKIHERLVAEEEDLIPTTLSRVSLIRAGFGDSPSVSAAIEAVCSRDLPGLVSALYEWFPRIERRATPRKDAPRRVPRGSDTTLSVK